MLVKGRMVNLFRCTTKFQLVLNTTVKTQSYLCCIFHPIYNMLRAMVIR